MSVRHYSDSAQAATCIPWFFTPNLVKGQKALTNCFNDVAIKNPTLHAFLIKECGYLLELQESSASNIPLDLLTPPIADQSR